MFITENTPLLFSPLIPGDPEIALINQSSDNEQWIITMGGGLLNAMRWKKKEKIPHSPREVFIWDLRIWMFLRLSLETQCGYFCHWPYPSQAHYQLPFPPPPLVLPPFCIFCNAISLFLCWKSKLKGFYSKTFMPLTFQPSFACIP